jgi:hypothetical protein
VSADKAAAAPDWWWGTNRPGGTFYSGRVHVVHPDQSAVALCGLPVGDVWELRPPVPQHLCPDCCVLAMAATYPPFTPSPAGRHERNWPGPSQDDPAEQTTELPVLADGDP